MPREVVNAPSLRTFEVWLDWTLSNLIKWEMSLPWSRWTFKGPSQPKPFCDSPQHRFQSFLDQANKPVPSTPKSRSLAGTPAARPLPSLSFWGPSHEAPIHADGLPHQLLAIQPLHGRLCLFIGFILDQSISLGSGREGA